ncbi:MAG: TldD/PmbA family protein [Euryarchaeota archaeon]|nr:TldD/PmbA family protein [Euryarchaeota archaeon]
MISIAAQAVEYAQRAGADEAEAYCVTDRSVSINTKLDHIEYARESFASGIGIRAIVSGAVGFSSVNHEDDVLRASELAVTSARASQPDPDWSALPAPGYCQPVQGVFDPALAEIELSRCVELAVDMVRGVRSIGAIPTSGGLSISTSTCRILNTNGIEHTEQGTMMHLFIECTMKEGGAISTAHEFGISRSFDVDAFEIGRDAARLARESMHGTAMETTRIPVLLGPIAIADILEYTFIPSLNADNVQKGRSMLSEIGAEVAPDELTILDDGLRTGGIGTAESDDEGTPSQKTMLIEDGVLKGHLHDAYTAGKASPDITSTGNATRAGYGTTPSVDVRNLVLNYQHPANDVIAETDRGVLVHSVIGAHTANHYSGDFSVEARNSFLIKNGEAKQPIKSIMIAGNVFDLLKNIDCVGADVRAVGDIVVPTVRVSDMQVIGS